MNSEVYLFTAFVIAGVALIIFGNRWLINRIEPKRSFRRFVVYFVIVLGFGFLFTVLFSYLILKLVI